MYDDDFEDYYEPSEVDQLVEEFRDKVREHLLPNIREEIERLNKENEKLRNKNEEYRKRESEINSKERDLKYKEDNLKREVEREFYEINIGDTLKQYIEDCEIWFANTENYQNQKCNLCNSKRELVANFPDGKTTKKECSCAKIFSKYVPDLSTITLIKFYKRNSRYPSDRKFYLSRTYSPPPNSRDDYSYQEFKIYHVIDVFNESIIELHKNKPYGEKLGFKIKEECQKYCDWLNTIKN